MLKLKERDQTIALAGVFQAAELVNQAATQGAWSGYAAEQSIQSLFKVSVDAVEDIFDGPFGVKLGLITLTSMLGGDAEQIQSLRYSASLLRLERQFHRKSGMQSHIGDELEKIRAMEGHPDDPSQLDQVVSAVANLYQDTISTIEPRVVVQGKPDHLQRERNLHWIRALLFAGLRSAVLWRQVGGSRWSLLFGRQKLLHAARELLHA
jgi:high frequency lysogenization protein